MKAEMIVTALEEAINKHDWNKVNNYLHSSCSSSKEDMEIALDVLTKLIEKAGATGCITYSITADGKWHNLEAWQQVQESNMPMAITKENITRLVLSSVKTCEWGDVRSILDEFCLGTKEETELTLSVVTELIEQDTAADKVVFSFTPEDGWGYDEELDHPVASNDQ